MASTASHKTRDESQAHASTPLNEQIQQLRTAMSAKVAAGDAGGAIDALLDVIAAQHHDIMRLTALHQAAIRARFGRRSERLTAEELGQLALALGATQEESAQLDPRVPRPEAEEEDATDDGKQEGEKEKKGRKAKRRHPGRTRLDPGLPRRTTLHCVPAHQRDCIHCGATMQTIGYVDHERVEYIPARIEVAVDRREKVGCVECSQDVTIAPRPGSKDAAVAGKVAGANSDALGEVILAETPGSPSPSMAKRSVSNNSLLAPGAHIYRRAGASLLAHLLEAKADDALPVYRQREQLARLGFDAPLNTLYGYWDAAAHIIAPVAQVVCSEVLGSRIVGVDDTRLDWLDPKSRSRRQRGHLWCFVGTGALVAFEFTETWCADEIAAWIDAIDGFIQCDDYKGYSASRRSADGHEGPLVPRAFRLGCWMHVRRPFHAAFKAGEKQAIIGLGHIKELYAIERVAKEGGLGPAERLALRQERSQPIAEAFFSWVAEQKLVVRPKSYLGKAVQYAADQKEFVMRCLTDGGFELDTGRVERQIREPVIGRKNYLFSGSAEAARRLANVYTLVCSCKNLGINTREYLVDIITKLQAGFPLRDINRLRPDIWATERSTLVAQQLAQ